MLDVEEVGVLDNFFELGGHSLVATRVVSRLRSIFGFDIPVRALFEHATVGATAEFIDGVRWAATGEIPALTQREELLL